MDFVIGTEIKKIIRERGMTNRAFADKMNMEERNLYHFFKKETIDLDVLLQASQVLDFNFLELYIKNSKFRKHSEIFNATAPISVSEEQGSYIKKSNQISFSIHLKGDFNKVTAEMSNFLQLVKKEAEQRGFELS
ncbi:conserved hypothetical protein [Sphingobacterium sp. PM2-P1-29]|nr:conserved hypothetical protein [Sphingobacterium sp. PM2-P1-29]